MWQPFIYGFTSLPFKNARDTDNLYATEEYPIISKVKNSVCFAVAARATMSTTFTTHKMFYLQKEM
jgi:hypothetical protein